MFDQNEFVENLSKFTPEQLAQYQGQHVAWSTDGKQILASSPTRRGLSAEVKRIGLPDEAYVCDYMDPRPVAFGPVIDDSELDEPEPGAA